MDRWWGFVKAHPWNLLGRQFDLLFHPWKFDLQINTIPRGSEDTVYGNGLFSEVQNRTYIVQGLLID